MRAYAYISTHTVQHSAMLFFMLTSWFSWVCLAVMSDDYFLTRMPIVEVRLAQGGVRLAAILNRIFGETEIHTY